MRAAVRQLSTTAEEEKRIRGGLRSSLGRLYMVGWAAGAVAAGTSDPMEKGSVALCGERPRLVLQ